MFNSGVFLLLFFEVTKINDVDSVTIHKLEVPDVIRVDTTEVVLNCVYGLKEDDYKFLVIKWLFNEKLVYQWIPGYQPVAAGVLKNNIDLNYKATEDPLKKHSSLKIKNLHQELSGNYTCLVSSLFNEDRKTKTMIVKENGGMVKDLNCEKANGSKRNPYFTTIFIQINTIIFLNNV